MKQKGASLQAAMPSIEKDEATAPNEYETKEHLNHLIKAHEIMNDPAKMKAIHKLAGRHSKAIKSIKELKDLHPEKYGKPAGNMPTLQGEHEPDADDME
jgi:hypothetical protein